jgi:hypothetical protein
VDTQAVSATRNLCQSGTGRTKIMASSVFARRLEEMTDDRRKEIEQREFENYVLPKLEEIKV